MDLERLKEELDEILTRDAKIVDSGIGYFEFWGKTGTDKRIGLNIDNEKDYKINLSEYLDEYDTKESLMQEELILDINISKSKGGDPDACAEAGRRSCGSCNACQSIEGTFTVKLIKIEKIEDKLFGYFRIIE